MNMNKYIHLARQAVSEGAVLLKNDNHVLPLIKGANVAVFGRNQLHYYKSGMGSGGMVNTDYVISILDALKNCHEITLNTKVIKRYEEWGKTHPFNPGNGWATEPWYQEEMPLEEDFVKQAAQTSDVAIIMIGRIAGEEKDNSPQSGSYLLTSTEEHMIQSVCQHFANTIVLLNTGNIIDMKWVEKYEPSSVMYVWQGGQEGGNGVIDLLLGNTSPSGKLTDTIAHDIKDYFSTEYFGNEKENLYVEDIYVGYRYFETFAPQKVLYPFGYGLSYTEFKISLTNFSWDGNNLEVTATVKNIGKFPGKEVVQLYKSAPQGTLGKPARELCGFAKTKELLPDESDIIKISCNKYLLSSYDDSGVSGYKSSYVLEAGKYKFYIGNHIRCNQLAGYFEIKNTELVQQLTAMLSPVKEFDRIRPVETPTGYLISYETVPTRDYNQWERIQVNRPTSIQYTGDSGYKLEDVLNKKISLESFIAQIPPEQLCVLLRGEGMCSPKVTAGTGGAFGGVSKTLESFAIPIACCTDGPSGLRMDVGTIAFSLPIGTCLACTFNEILCSQLYECLGLEMRKNKVDILLGPGMNLHRNPLNGRNFEYFSEDPLLSGKIAAALLSGMHTHNVTGTIKHFIANNQEKCRSTANNIISERAIRELYLKGFEIACKEGHAYCIMSTYGPVNGLWTASNYELLTSILRNEWGYKGLVMSDWWACGNEENEPGIMQEVAAMVRSQNDLYMVTANAEKNSNQDNLLAALDTDKLVLGELQRSAANVLRVLMHSPAMERYLGTESNEYQLLYSLNGETQEDNSKIVFDNTSGEAFPLEQISFAGGTRSRINLILGSHGDYKVRLVVRSCTDYDLAQLALSIFVNQQLVQTINLRGADRDWIEFTCSIGYIVNISTSFELYFSQSGLEIKSIDFFK